MTATCGSTGVTNDALCQPERSPRSGRSRRTVAYICAALILCAFAFSPPLDGLADGSFAWHMAQHLVLIYLVPAALLLVRPFDLVVRLSPKRATATFVHVTQPLHVLASAPVALIIFVATLWATHFSPLYQRSLDVPAMHAGEHFLYLAAGTIFWLPVIAPPPLRPLPYPARILYLLVALPQGALLAMVLASARAPLYPHYAAQLGTAGALADQANAAAVMWLAGGLVVLGALLATVGLWAARERVAESA